jgi:CubicO group peptidase (beta-lactamase class C family)
MASSGLSPAKLAHLHAAMSAHVERGDVPGVVTLIARRGEVYVDVAGNAAFDSAKPLARDAIFRISSMTKPITAVATLIAIEDGFLKLDDRIDALLPELADRRVLRGIDAPLEDTVPAQRAITVHDLLTFGMGTGILMAPPGTHPIQRALEELELGQGPPAPALPPPPDEWMRRLGTLPLMAQPGERWLYSTGSDVLGVLIARAAGQPFERFLKERIFEPLGMVDTAFAVAGHSLDRFGPCYWTDPASGLRVVFDAPEGGQWSTMPAFPSGAGGLVSTVDDFYAFAQMLLDGGRRGERRLLSRESVAAMTSDQLNDAQRAAGALLPGFFDLNGWGFGVSVVTREVGSGSGETLGKYGWNGGLGSLWACDPREEMVTILMTAQMWNSPDPPPICRHFVAAAYAAIDS